MDHIVGNAVAETEIIGASETVTGNNQQIVFQFCSFGECSSVTVWCFDE